MAGQLPRGLDALDELAGAIADHADPSVRVVLGGRVKHMTTAMNEVLGVHFREVSASRGVGKSRALHSGAPIPGAGAPWPRRAAHEGLTIVAHGAAFAGTGLDIGTRSMLEHLGDMPYAECVIDLGCGTGVLAASYALARPEARVIATDRSAAAVASASATCRANGVSDRVRVVRDDGLSSQPDGSADLVLLNPPFHSGAGHEPHRTAPVRRCGARAPRGRRAVDRVEQSPAVPTAARPHRRTHPAGRARPPIHGDRLRTPVGWMPWQRSGPSVARCAACS